MFVGQDLVDLEVKTYRALMLEGSWNERQWANWVRSALEAALLPP